MREQETTLLELLRVDLVKTLTNLYALTQRFSSEPSPGASYLSKPMGYSNFPKEIIPAPKAWVEKDGNLVFFRDHEKVR